MQTLRKDLLPAVKELANAIGTRKPMESKLLFEFNKGLKVTAGNGERQITIKIPQATGKETFAVDAKLMQKIVNALPQNLELVEFSLNGEKITVSSGQTEYEIETFNPEDFNKIEPPNNTNKFSIKKENFIDMIEKVAYSSSKEKEVRNLYGVFFEKKETTFRTVATDGYRMALAQIKNENFDKKSFGFIVPLNLIKQIQRMAKKSNGDDVVIQMEGQKVSFEFGNTIIICITPEADYPNYRMVIPEKNDSKIIAYRKPLIDAIKRIKIMSTKDYEYITLSTLNEKNMLTLSAKGVLKGKAKETIEIKSYGKKIEKTFNPIFLQQALEHINEETVVLKFIEDYKPLMIEPHDNDDCFSIIMPIRR